MYPITIEERPNWLVFGGWKSTDTCMVLLIWCLLKSLCKFFPVFYAILNFLTPICCVCFWCDVMCTGAQGHLILLIRLRKYLPNTDSYDQSFKSSFTLYTLCALLLQFCHPPSMVITLYHYNSLSHYYVSIKKQEFCFFFRQFILLFCQQQIPT